MRRINRQIPSALLLAAGLSITGLQAFAQDNEAAAVKVSVSAAYTKDLIDSVTFIGKGAAMDKVDIIARVNGFLKEVLVSDGADVAEGDLLFRIEPDAYQATLEAGEADLSRATANLELAQIELGRKEELVSRQASPQSEADIARANQSVAEAEVKAAKAAIRAAQLDVSYTEVFAPFPGRIGIVDRSVGDIVGPNAGHLVTLVREKPMQVEFSLSEKQLYDVLEQINAEVNNLSDSPEMPDVYLTMPNGTKLDEPGKVVFVDNRIDPATGSIALRAEFANEKRLIVDGSFVDVTIQAIEAETKLLIPQASVQRDQRGDFVLVVTSEQRVEQRYVTLGEQHETSIIVLDGMQEGEAVIVEGLQRVRPGVMVEAVTAGQPKE